MIQFLRRLFAVSDMVPRLPPRPKPKPPKGFRFGSTPPSLDCLVHLDNDKPYRNARRGERLLIYEGVCSRRFVGEGRVIGRMNGDDPRAKLVGEDPTVCGIFFLNERGLTEWRPDFRMGFWRREDGVLQFTR